MIDVYWQGKSDLGFLECEVVTRWDDGTPKSVRHTLGKERRVTYSHSERHYVWKKIT